MGSSSRQRPTSDIGVVAALLVFAIAAKTANAVDVKYIVTIGGVVSSATDARLNEVLNLPESRVSTKAPPPAPPSPPPVPNSPPAGSYEIEVSVGDEGGGSSARRLLQLGRDLLQSTDPVAIERLIVYDASDNVISMSQVSLVFEDDIVDGSDTYEQKTQKLKALANAGQPAVTFNVPAGETPLFTIVAQTEIGSIDLDIDDAASAKLVSFKKKKWSGAAQVGDAKAVVMRAHSLAQNGRYKRRFFDFRTDSLSNSLTLSKLITVPWNDQKRFDALVNTDVAYVQKIIFNYKPGAHDVMLMASQTAYDSCDFAGATAVSASGININAGGTYHFASSKPGDCSAGLKQTYSITPLPSPPPPPSPSPPPPPSPSPPPSTPTCYLCGPRNTFSYFWNEPVYFTSTAQNFPAKCADAQGTDRDLNGFYLTATSAFECHGSGQTTCLCPAPVKLPSGNVDCGSLKSGCYLEDASTGGGQYFVKQPGGFNQPEEWCWSDNNSGRYTSLSGAVCKGGGDKVFCECSGGKRRSLLADEKSSLPALPGLDDRGRGFQN